MWQKNYGQEEHEIFQNLFTAYLTTAVRRRRAKYTQQLQNYQGTEHLMASVQSLSENNPEKEFPLYFYPENDALLDALRKISRREQYVFLSRVLDEKSFESLAKELGLSYKGVAAVYYRSIQKIKKRMEETKK